MKQRSTPNITTILSDEETISQLIIDSFFKKFKNSLSCDVVVVGSGPAGLVCSYILARQGIKTVLFERKGSLGGGIWGGGMMFNTIVFEKNTRNFLTELGIAYNRNHNNYITAHAPEVAACLSAKVCSAGVHVFNFINVEDIIVSKRRICGVVVNWTPVEMTKQHVDPLMVKARYVVDATGHEASITRIAHAKLSGSQNKKKRNMYGEKAMNVAWGEREVVKNSKEIIPGLFVAGMAANAIGGGHRMGPLFGGMFYSGKKVAQLIIEKMKK